MKRGIAIRAALDRRHFDAQPMAARDALWIYALHSAARQKYHMHLVSARPFVPQDELKPCADSGYFVAERLAPPASIHIQ
ncbi:MAG TPA: hypothetical protein VGR94_05735 [Candidatus Acidoferrales bacterium]|nr:hypothetical protein [Candidatus Acidoferrales bacterium]